MPCQPDRRSHVKTLVEPFEAVVAAGGMLRRGERILVAVSGGVDSMVLLHLLHQLARPRQWKLAVAHFNHQLRGRASDADERLVRTTAKALGLPFHGDGAAVKVAARRRGMSIEMAARELRHAFLARTAKRLNCRSIALAQHADDQVELCFLRLLRGAGGEGLAGMKLRAPSPADAGIKLVRPLLHFTKADLEAFAREHHIPFRKDASNASVDMLRNRVRLELLPFLRRRFQPALNQTVLRTMAVVGAESEAVAEVAGDWLQRVGRKRPWSALPVGVQRQVIQLQLQQHHVVSDFDLIESLRCAPGKTINIAPRRSLVLDERGRVQRVAVPFLAFSRRILGVALGRKSGESCFDGLHFAWQLGKRTPEISRKAHCEFFDADKVGSRITLRHWQPGDRFQPIGMTAAIKLQDWFTNQKIPATRRRELVIATTARGEIFWIEGLRIGERFKFRPETRRHLRWTWRRPASGPMS